MALEEYLESEVAVAIVATAVALSPRARRLVRRGAVYGLAGALMAGDAVATFARGAVRGAQQAAVSTAPPVADAATQPMIGTPATGGEA